MIRAPILLAALAFAAAAAAQTIYRWTDANGKVHYTSDPPPGTRAAEVRSRASSYAAPAQAAPAQPAPSAPRAAAPAALPVVMYATSWCPHCARARAYFASQGIAYTEHDVEKSAAANAEFKRLGGRGVPLIVVGREKMSGFSPEGFDALLARAAR